MPSALKLIRSRKPLHILHLSSVNAQVYLAKSNGTTLIETPSGIGLPADLSNFAAAWLAIPWVILVDQSEESFWGGVMPTMRGAAKTAWIERLSAQSGSDSPYRWSELQGKSRSQPDKLRILGYTLGRPEGLTPWLDALHNCGARVRGVYSPVMLTATALSLLKIKPLKNEDDIGVLVTPHADGLRQSVLVGGKVRFSRLALHPSSSGAAWFDTIYSETARLREYLIGSGLLKGDRAGMHLYVVLPTTIDTQSERDAAIKHARDQYHWIESPLENLVYLAALVKSQPLAQLAPPQYIKHDLSIRITRLIYGACAVVAAAVIAYAAYTGVQLWDKQLEIEATTKASNSATQQYLAVAKNFPPTPLTATQLVEMSKRWQAIKSTTPPNMRDLLVIAGQVLANHPQMIIETMQWAGEVPGQAAAPSPSLRSGLPPLAPAEKKDIASLVLGGTIRGIASDDLRGTRDALSRLAIDFNRDPNIRAEITKKPLDLSTKAALTGSGKQEQSELVFEIKLWQR